MIERLKITLKPILVIHVSSRSIKMLLYFIGTQKRRAWKPSTPRSIIIYVIRHRFLTYLDNQIARYTPEFFRIGNLQRQLSFIIFNQFIRPARMIGQQFRTLGIELDFLVYTNIDFSKVVLVKISSDFVPNTYHAVFKA